MSTERSFGSFFIEYCDMKGCTLADVAATLGCDTATLAWLSLCRRPPSDAVLKIAQSVPINAVKLVEILHRVDARAPVTTED